MTKIKTIILTLFVNIVIFPLLLIGSTVVSNKIYFDILGKTGNNDLLVFGENGGNGFAILLFIILNIISLSVMYFLDKKQESSSINEEPIREGGEETKIKNAVYYLFTLVIIVVISVILFGVLLLIASNART